jgi:hypothetical protein
VHVHVGAFGLVDAELVAPDEEGAVQAALQIHTGIAGAQIHSAVAEVFESG